MSTKLGELQTEDCTTANNQAQLNVCSAKLVMTQSKRLNEKLAGICEHEPEIWANRGGSMFLAMSNECVSKKLAAIIKKVK